MVTIRFKEIEVQELLLWGKDYKDGQESVGMDWDEDQQKIVGKLRKSIGKKVKSADSSQE